MPEEINRVLTDHIATLLCCPTQAAITHLQEEGIRQGVHHVGDVMYDAALLFGRLADQDSRILDRLGLQPKAFRLCTVHRAENTDSEERMRQIVSALQQIATTECPLVLPLHPRTRQRLESYDLLAMIEQHNGIRLTSPLGFLDMVALEKQALTILTDSGGVQKEAYFHHTPCVTLREETEWVETVEAGWNCLAGYQTQSILDGVNYQPEQRHEISEYGTGRASDDIVRLMVLNLK